MGETDPQDRVQATKEHLKEAADDLHSATKAKAAQFQNVVEDTWSDAQSRGADVAGGNWSIYSAKPNQGGVHGFWRWISLESQVVEISWYRDIRAGTLSRLRYPQSRCFSNDQTEAA